MSTLDPAGNSNGEIPVHCWPLTEKYPQLPNEHHYVWIKRLMAIADKEQTR